ncbi:hypothetical protein DFJ74DRAFT_666610 [Hyaloraphidium curvatum]|nr:hypothetical protein DFJ74DRAFT_666610 [Hyaloraphidium curvatum]
MPGLCASRKASSSSRDCGSAGVSGWVKVAREERVPLRERLPERSSVALRTMLARMGETEVEAGWEALGVTGGEVASAVPGRWRPESSWGFHDAAVLASPSVGLAGTESWPEGATEGDAGRLEETSAEAGWSAEPGSSIPSSVAGMVPRIVRSCFASSAESSLPAATWATAASCTAALASFQAASKPFASPANSRTRSPMPTSSPTEISTSSLEVRLSFSGPAGAASHLPAAPPTRPRRVSASASARSRRSSSTAVVSDDSSRASSMSGTPTAASSASAASGNA